MLGSIPTTLQDSRTASQYSLGEIEADLASLTLDPDKSLLVLYDRKRSNSDSSANNLIKLKTEFKAESHQGYLTETTRQKYKVTCKDTFFYGADGFLLNGIYIYVLDPEYQLYCAPLSAQMQHSYFTAGHKVRGAGIMYLSTGRLITMSNESGHYTPTHEEMQGAIAWFYQQVKGHTFLFEDHSAQDKTLEFNGIKYYTVSPFAENADIFVKNQLSNCNLLRTLDQLRKTEIQYYLDAYNTEDQEYDSEEYADTGNSNIYFSTFSVKELVQPKGSDNIFDYPELLNLTCLQNVNKGIFSRYGCHLKPSYKAIK